MGESKAPVGSPERRGVDSKVSGNSALPGSLLTVYGGFLGGFDLRELAPTSSWHRCMLLDESRLNNCCIQQLLVQAAFGVMLSGCL